MQAHTHACMQECTHARYCILYRFTKFSMYCICAHSSSTDKLHTFKNIQAHPCTYYNLIQHCRNHYRQLLCKNRCHFSQMVIDPWMKFLSICSSLAATKQQKHVKQACALCVFYLCTLWVNWKDFKQKPNWCHIHRLYLQAGLWTACTFRLKNTPQQSKSGRNS